MRMVVTDGVFSMDGDIAPLPKIADLCEKHECVHCAISDVEWNSTNSADQRLWIVDCHSAILMIDECHGTGVIGKVQPTLAHTYTRSHPQPPIESQRIRRDPSLC